jgi:hypothetical protein
VPAEHLSPRRSVFLVGDGTLIWALVWALTGAAFSVRLFQSWWMHAPPPSAAAQVLEVVPSDIYDSVLGALFLVVVMGIVLTSLWLGALISGAIYMRGTQPTRTLRRAWACAVASAAVVSIGFLGVFLDPVPLFGEVVIGHADWGLLGFSAAFLATGCAMAAIIRSIRANALAGTTRIRA